jgi:hypothetical protein
VQFDLLHTYLQINDSFISLVDAKNKAIRLHHEDPKTPLYRVLLLTLRIDDLLGRTGQERFLQVCSPFPDQSSWAPPSPQSDPKRLVGRILEIQGLPVGPALDLKHLWDALFPPDTDNFVEQDAKARIVGISPPIYPFTGSSCP